MRKFLAAPLLLVTLISLLTLPQHKTVNASPRTQPAGNSDVKVWVNTKSGVYHCPGTRWYGNTKSGQYMTEAQAQDKSFRPAYGKPCGSAGEARPEPTPPQTKGEAEAGRSEGSGNPDTKVWVNTKSAVYHCPGTRWYGNTKNGQYMSQKEAEEKGNRPAYGKPCQ